MTTVEIIPTQTYMGRSLIHHDPRSKDFRATSLLMPHVTPRNKAWRQHRPYDQGPLPHCVAFTGKGILNTSPANAWAPYRARSQYSTTDMYHGAQANDEWPGESYDGTSGLGLCRFLKSIGRIREYRWCFSLEEYLLALSYEGPIGFGTWWKSDMMGVDERGFIHASGNNVGGHEVKISAVNVDDEYVWITNSWGVGWGAMGKAKLSFDDLRKLIQEDADGFVITG